MDVKLDPSYPHFASIPWTLSLLSAPTVRSRPTSTRVPKPDTTEDSLFAETLRTPTTVLHSLCFYHLSPSPPSSPPTIEGTEFFQLFTLGSGMNGQPGVLHGGMVATLIDETMGCLIGLIQEQSEPRTEDEVEARTHPKFGGEVKVVTAELTTRFLKPLRTPGTVLVTARMGGIEGRKWRIEASVEGEGGERIAGAESLWVQLRGRGRL